MSKRDKCPRIPFKETHLRENKCLYVYCNWQDAWRWPSATIHYFRIADVILSIQDNSVSFIHSPLLIALLVNYILLATSINRNRN